MHPAPGEPRRRGDEALPDAAGDDRLHHPAPILRSVPGVEPPAAAGWGGRRHPGLRVPCILLTGGGTHELVEAEACGRAGRFGPVPRQVGGAAGGLRLAGRPGRAPGRGDARRRGRLVREARARPLGRGDAGGPPRPAAPAGRPRRHGRTADARGEGRGEGVPVRGGHHHRLAFGERARRPQGPAALPAGDHGRRGGGRGGPPEPGVLVPRRPRRRARPRRRPRHRRHLHHAPAVRPGRAGRRRGRERGGVLAPQPRPEGDRVLGLRRAPAGPGGARPRARSAPRARLRRGRGAARAGRDAHAARRFRAGPRRSGAHLPRRHGPRPRRLPVFRGRRAPDRPRRHLRSGERRLAPAAARPRRAAPVAPPAGPGAGGGADPVLDRRHGAHGAARPGDARRPARRGRGARGVRVRGAGEARRPRGRRGRGRPRAPVVRGAWLPAGRGGRHPRQHALPRRGPEAGRSRRPLAGPAQRLGDVHAGGPDRSAPDAHAPHDPRAPPGAPGGDARGRLAGPERGGLDAALPGAVGCDLEVPRLARERLGALRRGRGRLRPQPRGAFAPQLDDLRRHRGGLRRVEADGPGAANRPALAGEERLELRSVERSDEREHLVRALPADGLQRLLVKPRLAPVPGGIAHEVARADVQHRQDRRILARRVDLGEGERAIHARVERGRLLLERVPVGRFGLGIGVDADVLVPEPVDGADRDALGLAEPAHVGHLERPVLEASEREGLGANLDEDEVGTIRLDEPGQIRERILGLGEVRPVDRPHDHRLEARGRRIAWR
ncbi:hypothetical protein Adeh_0560 [Anaeromyxobacter dehalogenans 2CP-C]|uniref:Uncharacterized protein n=1 Tax=Anaeromyxobacter dehalogenans (strain 2CP-C) TaxID=290397 RepID=Q2INF4_ANADE|nr:hypothetical protein Adeh_0560 [Anaeromyxobacter dehalogenans 2CP-C]